MITCKVDLSKLRTLAKQQLIHDVSQKLDAAIDSLHDRQDYARYHYHEYKKILSKADNDVQKFRLALSLENEDKKDVIAIKANMTACMQSLHVTHDILAYLIAKVLDLGISEHDITFRKVKEKVSNCPALKKLMTEFSEHHDFKYLNAFVNHSKHRFNIEPKLTFHFTGNKHVTAFFEAFTYGENQYKPENINTFLEREYNREQKLIIDIENELIRILESKENP